MKYIIEDKQLFDAIYKFIDDDLVEDNLSWNYEEENDDEELNKQIVSFVGNKYINDEIDERYFTYITKKYYEILMKTEPEFVRDWINIAPLLDLNPCRWWCDKMNTLFSDYWKPAFEQWFRDRYPNFKVKTFTYP